MLPNIEFSDGEAETAEAQEDSADISVEEDTGSAEAQTEDFQAEEPSEEAVTVNEENADFSADAEDALFSDGAEAVEMPLMMRKLQQMSILKTIM